MFAVISIKMVFLCNSASKQTNKQKNWNQAINIHHRSLN